MQEWQQADSLAVLGACLEFFAVRLELYVLRSFCDLTRHQRSGMASLRSAASVLGNKALDQVFST